MAAKPAGGHATEDERDAQTEAAPQLSWGAELEFELSEPGGDAEEVDAHFQIDQLYLYPVLTLAPDTRFSADIAVKGDGTYIEEAWLYWARDERLWVKVGLEDPVIAQVDRKSEAEILLETAFYRSDEVGLQLGGALGSRLEWWASATNGSELPVKQPSEDPAFPLVHDARRLDGAGALMLGAGLKITGTLGSGTGWLMPWTYDGQLSQADIAFLGSVPGLSNQNSDRKERQGANVGWESGRLTVLAQAMRARDGALERGASFVQPSWRLSDRFELTYRYNRLRVDLPPVATDSRTWDRTQHVFALISSLTESVLLKAEYYVNEEETGGASVSNDELLLQLELSWPP